MLPHIRVVHRKDGLRLCRWVRQSPSLVFTAFSDAELLARWWGPPHCPIVESRLEFRTGGVWHYCTRSVDSGTRVWSRAVFEEIQPPTRLTFTETSSDEHGAVTPDRAPAKVRVELVPLDSGTEITIDVAQPDERAASDARERGIENGLSRAVEHLATVLDEKGMTG